MNRVYLLLRDNIESGPYTFDELLQQHLQPSDLIWIEGKTSAWAYPNEIEDLKNSLTGTPVEQVSFGAIVPSATKITTPEIKLTEKKETKNAEDELNLLPKTAPRKPKGEIEKRAEELRKKALAFSAQHNYQHQPVLHPIHDFQPHLHDQDAVDFVHHKQHRSLPVGEILVAAMMIGLVVVGWYGGANKYFFNRKAPQVNTVATQLVASDTHAAAAPAKSQTGIPAVDSLPAADSVSVIPVSAYQQEKSPIAIAKLPTTEARKDSPGIVQKTQLAELTGNSDTETTHPDKIVVPEKKQADISEAKEPEKKQSAETKSPELKKEKEDSVKQQPTAEEDKKKTLGEVFKGLFKKKKKDN